MACPVFTWWIRASNNGARLPQVLFLVVRLTPSFYLLKVVLQGGLASSESAAKQGCLHNGYSLNFLVILHTVTCAYLWVVLQLV